MILNVILEYLFFEVNYTVFFMNDLKELL